MFSTMPKMGTLTWWNIWTALRASSSETSDGVVTTMGFPLSPPIRTSELPLNPDVRIGGDSGKPIVLDEDPRKPGAGFLELARNTVARIEEIGPPEGPRIEITD